MVIDRLYLSLSKPGLINIVMYDIWYDYVNPKYVKKARLSYMDTDPFIVYIKIKEIYVDITQDVQARFDSYEIMNWTDHYRKKKIKKQWN